MLFLKNNKFLLFIIAIAVTLYVVYNFYPQYVDFIFKPSQREIYKRNLSGSPKLLKTFDRLEQVALKDSVLISESYFEQVQTDSTQPFTAGYVLDLKLGEQVRIFIAGKSASKDWFLEIYEDTDTFISEAAIKKDTLLLEARFDKPKKVKIVLQARLASTGPAPLTVVFLPRFSFPVSGKGNKEIQSFWGAARGGGSRSHEGNDIFAPKGNPVVAAVNGVVTAVRDQGLGGKQVWLRDDDTGFLLYHAHLDSWTVKENQRVKTGDTLGRVGNTGNARTTPPHLHFGIYASGAAVDPKPFIWETPKPATFTSKGFIKTLQTTGNAANLRFQPNNKGKIIKLLSENVNLVILGTLSQWYHVRTPDGSTGYLHTSVVK